MRKDRRRRFLLASSALIAAPLTAIAQPAQRLRRIGFLSPFPPPPPGAPWLFREALKRAGYEEGKNLVIEARFAEGNVERLPALAEELVRSNVELIVASVNSGSDAARRATQTIPIVMLGNMFPVERGLVASLARPGGNITGTVWWAKPRESAIKIFQILKEAVPRAKRSAQIWDPTDPQARFYDMADTERSVAAIGMNSTFIAMTQSENLEAALGQLKASRAEVLYVTGYPAVASRWREIAAFALEQKLVSISDTSPYLNAGGLLSYGPNIADLFDRTVSYVDRIVRGAKPGDLAVEQVSKYESVLNTKTAKAIGFKPPPSFMLRVDRLVE